MYFPVTQTFNFFDDIFSLIEFAKKQDFVKFENQTWPGKRTISISQLNFNLFSYITRRQLRLFYNLEQLNVMSWAADSYFQLSTPDDILECQENMGWIHNDLQSMLTTIIYLTPNNINMGTSIFFPKQIGFIEDENLSLKTKFHSSYNPVLKDEELYEYENNFNRRNEKFYEVSKFKSILNSCVFFDGSYAHAGHFNFDNDERLTLITFYKSIVTDKFPVPDSKKVI